MTTYSRAPYRALVLSLPLLALFLALPTPTHADYQIPDNKTAVLRFTSSNTVPGSCTGSGPFGWTAARPDAGTWTVPVALNTLNLYTPYSFTFTCTSTADSNQGGAPVSAVAPMVVIPGQQVKVSFVGNGQANPLDFTPTLSFDVGLYYVADGQADLFTWNYSDRYGTCTASGAWSGTRLNSSSLFITLNNPSYDFEITKTFTLTCTSRNGKSAQISRTISVSPRVQNCGPNRICSVE